MTNYYLGKISKIIDRVTYQVEVDIDGIVESKPAFPMRGEVDEPKVGDDVLLRNIDPIYGSMYLYSKLKEDNFIGFRSNGKSIDITPDSIVIKSYKSNSDGNDDYSDVSASITIDKDGNIDIVAERKLTIKAAELYITGPGIMTINGIPAIPDPEGGPFTSVIAGPTPGQPGVSGKKIILNK